MKTSIKTLFATGLIALATSLSTVYANDIIKSENTISASSVNIASIKKLIIKGNVEVTISQDRNSNVLYTNEGSQNVLVKKLGNTIFVSSTDNAKITLFIDDIYRLEVADDAVVNSKNTLSLKYLQVFLADNAKLGLNAKTEDLYTNIKNNANLSLSGKTGKYKISMDKSCKFEVSRFNSKSTEMNSEVYISRK
ncbi:GIN domain-containing protein [Pedobacter namyangjuensis]|uniref:GIN domain-containing protein n=1 Tax=Pedobacter namyangjuensis TaxID=600626 RepID=UPI000DE52FC2|nr:DUF2807 domain-containing protein [Pedobacter namyangjuensis]